MINIQKSTELCVGKRTVALSLKQCRNLVVQGLTLYLMFSWVLARFLHYLLSSCEKCSQSIVPLLQKFLVESTMILLRCHRSYCETASQLTNHGQNDVCNLWMRLFHWQPCTSSPHGYTVTLTLHIITTRVHSDSNLAHHYHKGAQWL